MRDIKAGDWSLKEFEADTVKGCESGSNQVEITSFGLESDDHDGFLDNHEKVSFGASGRSRVRGGRKGQIVFRWKIKGWEFVEEATLWIFRWGSDRPIGLELVRSAEGKAETYGTVAGIRLTGGDQKVITNDVFTAQAGPYMARLHISKVKSNTKVVVGARRTYFDVLPIAVIGAGAAGLRAAAALLETNESVVLIEARDRVGGRAHTVPSQRKNPIDLGCQWLHSSNRNPWVLHASGCYLHTQKPVVILSGDIVDKNPFEKLVEDSLKSCTPDESFEAALARLVKGLAREEAKKEILQKQKQEIDSKVDKEIDDRGRKEMVSYDPVKDEGGAKSEFFDNHEDVKKIEKTKDRLLAAQTKVKEGSWKKDDDFLSRLKERKQKTLKERLAKERGKIASELEKEALQKNSDEVDKLALQKEGALGKDPLLRLAAAKESELEESIEAGFFTGAGRRESELLDGGEEEDDDSLGSGGSEEKSEKKDAGPSWKPSDSEDFRYVDPPEVEVPETGKESTNQLAPCGYGEVLKGYKDELAKVYGALLNLRLDDPVKVVQSFAKDETPFVIIESKDKIAAAGVVVTVPTGVINEGAIKFDPPLPKSVLAAFAALPMGHYKKIVLELKESSALGEHLKKIAGDIKETKESGVIDLSLFTLDEKRYAWKFLFRRKENIVVAFTGGELALELDKVEKLDEVVKSTVAALAAALKIDPEKISSSVESSLTSRWSVDPYSLGAYSYTRPKGVGMRKRLCGSVAHRCIVFAGEALWYEEYGTAHGAYLSGETAAKLLESVLL